MKNSSSTPIGLRFLISGRVQGVFYRRFAQQSAEALNVTGWARNLADGEVEVYAFGTEMQLASFQKKLQKGPLAAVVKQVTVHSIAWEDHPRFQIIAI